MPVGCFVCRSRKVRCDRSEPKCLNCRRLGVQCPGYASLSDPGPTSSQKSSRASLEDIYRVSGVPKRRVGSCKECRRTKSRCSRRRPTCQHCEKRGLLCEYASASSGYKINVAATSTEEPELEPESSKPGTGGDALGTGKEQGPNEPDDPGLQTPSPRMAWLYEDSLPSEKNSVYKLSVFYFEQVASLRCLGFIHQPDYFKALDEGCLIERYGEPLICIIAALGARLAYMVNNANELNIMQHGTPGEQWATKARDLAMRQLPNPSLQTLMTMILICEYAMYLDQHTLAYVIFGCCYRTMQLLSLDSEEPLEIDNKNQSWQIESGRRAVWSCYILDACLGSGVDGNLSWKDGPPGIPLPLPDAEFVVGRLSSIHESPKMKEIDMMHQGQGISVRGHIVYLMQFRTKVLRLIRSYDDGSKQIWEAGASFLDIIQTLETWFTNLPNHLLVPPVQSPARAELQNPGATFMLHFLYHSIICDLTRISLAGYGFPLAKAFKYARQSFREQCRLRCRAHADEVSQLARIGLSYGQQAFDDLHSLMAIFESTKIQIVHTATATSNSRDARQKASENIRWNLRALDTMHSQKFKLNPFYKSLMPLIKKFGFEDIGTEWAADQNSRPSLADLSEVTGSAKKAFLSNVAPFRLAKEQTQQKVMESKATSTTEMHDEVHLHNQISGMALTETQSGINPSKDARHIIADTSEFVCGAYEYSNLVSQQRDFGQEVLGTSAASTVESFPTDDHKLAVGYSRLADGMADYICWDMSSGLPSWIDFDATSADL